ncbi:unnamed protein product [Kluyveromyces dobzhanskii CBS 2104]|uniref:WGS project CCBQ000000000 data, contig 00051 n=1 Tax=Kluyveromyces dobzhanskii CBS 2104 TaxID=1427455 RepID=A0A0A8L4Y4_9SACH|nr:unnamed protein product [Kluyveromyces dobzhanskii CBS 2104]
MSKFQQLSEAQERSLVEKVDLRLVLANDDIKFEQTLNTFLPPLLLKLASPYSSIREFVYESIKHITSRVNSNPACKLPVFQLLKQVKNPNLNEEQDSTNVIIYSSFFLSKGIERLTVQESKDLLPDLLEGISKLPISAQTRLFQILCKALLTWQAPPKGTEEEKQTVEFLHVNDPDLKFLLEKFVKFFLLIPKNTRSNVSSYSCPGLSVDDVSFFMYSPAIQYTKELLSQYKRAIFDFVVSGLTTDEQIILPFLLVVSVQPIDISDSASTLLKRIEIPFEKKTFIQMLANMFCGDQSQHLPPVNAQIQEKILGILTRSVVVSKLPGSSRSISMQGIASDNPKVKLATLMFIRHIAQYNYGVLQDATEDGRNSIVSAIINDIKLYGWPRYNSLTENKNSGVNLRISQYETVGQLLKHDFDSLKNFEVVTFLFDSLKGDLDEFRLTIKDVLGSLAPHFPNLPLESKNKFKQFLSTVLKDNHSLLFGTSDEKEAIMITRFVAMKLNNAAFPFNDSDARIFNIMGTSPLNRYDVIQEAYKGINPYQFRMNQASLQTGIVSTDALLAKQITEIKFVDFSSFVSSFFRQTNNAHENSSIKTSIITAVRFIRQVLISNAIYGTKTVVVQDENWSLRIERSMDFDDNVRKLVHTSIVRLSDDTMTAVLSFLHNELVHQNNSSPKDDVIFSSFFQLLVTLAADSVIMKSEYILASLLKHILTKQSIPDLYVDHAVNAIGILGAKLGPNSLTVQQFLLLSHGQESRIQSENESAFVYVSSSLISRLQALHPTEFSSDIFNVLEKAIEWLKSTSRRELCLKVLCQLLKFKSLGILNADSRNHIISSIKKAIKDKLSNDERAIMAWGYLSMNADEIEFDEFLGVYETIHSSKHVDYLFSAGEGLTIILGGWNSHLLLRQLDLECDVKLLQAKSTQASSLRKGLDKILQFCSSSNPSLQKASCIWLLCIVQYLGHLPTISNNFKDIHSSFMRFLAHRDEFVQESASRGLSIVYNLSDSDMQEMMVKGLFKTLTNSSSALSLQGGSVSAETELFDAGVLNTNDGSISTYKDILNLANEVNDPGLVYKFMSLAKNSTLWTSRKGVAFGLSAIMSKVSLQDQIMGDSNLSKKLVPKLFRYKFDSSQSVANSMNNIWDTLFPDGSQAVEKYFDDVLGELLFNSGNREWRVRQACSSALLYLVQTYSLEKFEDKFEEIWTTAFRLMDDIKDSVRTAGTTLARTLSKLLISSMNSERNTAKMRKSKILDIILPFLLGTKGLNCDAEEVRGFAIKMILDLVKESKDSLKSHIPTLVYELTLLLSVLEPQVINYLTLNADKYNVKASVIDEHRLQGVSNSPIMQAIESLIDISGSSDAEIQGLVDSCIRASKKSVGLPSNIGASRVLQLICIRHSILLKSFSGKLLKACYNGMNSKNFVVASSYASSFGRLFKISKLDKQIKYSMKLTDRFFETEDIEKQKVVGIAIDAIHKYSTEDFDNVANILMPLVYVAKYTVNDDISELFDTIWVEASKSGSSSLNICFPEVIDLITIHIKSNVFSIRQTCTSALCKACQSYEGTLKVDRADTILNIFLEACKGRSWDGKELVISGVVESVKKLSSRAPLNETLSERIDSMMIAEATRKNRTYVKNIIKPFAEYVFFRNDEKLYRKFTSLTKEVFTNVEPQDDSENQESDINVSKKPRLVNDMNRASSKENIEVETYKIEIIKTIAEGYTEIAHTKNGIDTAQVVQLIFEFMREMFESSKIAYSWRSELAYFEVAILLIGSRTEPKRPLSENSKTFTDIWTYGYGICNQKETIENVKIKLIRYGGLLKEKLPHTSTMVNHGVSEIIRVDVSSVLKMEAVKIGAI